MSSGEREEGVEKVTRPIIRKPIMTTRTICSEAHLGMTGVGSRCIIGHVAIHARRAEAFPSEGVAARVAIDARSRGVSSLQDEAIHFVHRRDVGHEPTLRIVAPCTIVPDRHRVDVRVARCAVRRNRFERQRVVAIVARNHRVCPLQPEAGTPVIKRCRPPIHRPTQRIVADIAIQGEVFAVGMLSEEGTAQHKEEGHHCP